MNLKHITTTILLSVVIGLSFNTVYGDHLIVLPELPVENAVGIDVQSHFQSDNRYTVVITVQYQSFDTPDDIPRVIEWFDIEGNHFEITLRDDFTVANNPTVTPTNPDYVSPAQAKLIEAEKARIIIDGYDYTDVENALTCLYGDEERGNSVYQGYSAVLQLEKMKYFKQLPMDNKEKQLIMWTEACRVFESFYHSNDPRYANMAEAQRLTDIQPFFLDDSDSPLTNPVTQADLEKQAEIAEDYKCSEEGKRLGFCDAENEFTGINRGDKDGYAIPGWYHKYLVDKDQPTDLEKAVRDAMKTQCAEYFPHYEAVGFDNMPTWLNHCVKAETN